MSTREVVVNRLGHGYATAGDTPRHRRLNGQVVVPLHAVFCPNEHPLPVQDRLKRAMVALSARHDDIGNRLAEPLHKGLRDGRKKSRLVFLVVGRAVKRILAIAFPIINVRSLGH